MKTIEQIRDNKWKVTDIYKKFSMGEIFIDNTFQRRYVWETKHQVALIETILLGFDIPVLYFWEQSADIDTGVIKYSVVDGQQRLGAIVNYINGVFKLEKKYLIDNCERPWAGKTFQELNSDCKKAIWDYSIGVKEIASGVGIEDIKTLFLRLNTTNKVLNPQELRNAQYHGKFVLLSMELANNEFWRRNNIFTANDIRRMNDVEFVSNLICFLRFGYKTDLGSKTLNKAYDMYNKEYKEMEDDKKTVETTINVLQELFDYCENDVMKKTTHIYTIFVVLHKFITNNYKVGTIINGREEVFEYIKSFYSLYNSNEYNNYVNIYKEASSFGVKSKLNREKRISSLMAYINSQGLINKLSKTDANNSKMFVSYSVKMEKAAEGLSLRLEQFGFKILKAPEIAIDANCADINKIIKETIEDCKYQIVLLGESDSNPNYKYIIDELKAGIYFKKRIIILMVGNVTLAQDVENLMDNGLVDYFDSLNSSDEINSACETIINQIINFE